MDDLKDIIKDTIRGAKDTFEPVNDAIDLIKDTFNIKNLFK